MCKALNKLPTDPEIRSLTTYQMAWMTQQIALDDEEDFERMISIAEYLGCFINNEAAQRAREHRKMMDGRGDNVKESTDFEELVKDQFGRELDTQAPPELSTNDSVSHEHEMAGVDARELQAVEVIRRKRNFVPQE